LKKAEFITRKEKVVKQVRSIKQGKIVIAQHQFSTKTENNAWQSFAEKNDLSAAFFQGIKS
jgi:hypothetical protein